MTYRDNELHISRRSAFAAGAAMLTLHGVSAQTFPGRPVRVIVPAPGGSPPT